MIYITQLIYLNAGEEKTFEEFESKAIPMIAEHGGALLQRIRLSKESVLVSEGEPPYEIHFISFPSEDKLQNFLKDPERKIILPLKNQSIRESVLILGEKL